MRVQRGGMRPPVTAIPLACAVILLAALAPSAIAAQGQWERAWGKDVVFGGGSTGFENCTVAADCQPGATGTDLGEMNAPEGVATDAAGNVYVADTGNNRIQEFDSQGNWQRAWGKDVVSGDGTGFEVCSAVATDCRAGATGGLGGEM